MDQTVAAPNSRFYRVSELIFDAKVQKEALKGLSLGVLGMRSLPSIRIKTSDCTTSMSITQHFTKLHRSKPGPKTNRMSTVKYCTNVKFSRIIETKALENHRQSIIR